MNYNWRAIWAIARKDLKVVTQNRGVLIPMIVVPLVFLVLLPLGAGLIPQLSQLPGSMPTNVSMEALLSRMPPDMTAELADVPTDGKMVVFLLQYLFAPMFLIIPLMVASVIAADSFAGEKERKTLEAILYTPTTDRELFLAKSLGGWVPATVISVVGFVLYCVTANIGGWPTVGRVFFPNLAWVVLAVWVAPAAAGLGLSFTVLVSARAKSFQEAYQMGAMVVLPLVLLMFGQIAGAIYFSPLVVFGVGLVLWLADAGLVWLGSKSFKRGELIAKL